MAHSAETALLILNLISMLSKFSVSICSTFIHLNHLFFPPKESSLSSLFKYCPFPSSFYFMNISGISFFPPLHSNKKKKKTYSELFFLKKKAPHLPSCSPFCFSLIHFPHKQILLKHRLDHVTHPLKSLLPKTFQFLKKNAKFLTLIWNDKQGSPLPVIPLPTPPPHPRVYQPLFEFLLYSNLFPDSESLQACPTNSEPMTHPCQNNFYSVVKSQLKDHLFREGFLVPQV